MAKPKQLAISVLGSLFLSVGFRFFEMNSIQKRHQSVADGVCKMASLNLDVGDAEGGFVNLNQELLKMYSIEQFCVSIRKDNQLLSPSCGGLMNKDYPCATTSDLRANVSFYERGLAEFNYVNVFAIFFIVIEALQFLVSRFKRVFRK